MYEITKLCLKSQFFFTIEVPSWITNFLGIKSIMKSKFQKLFNLYFEFIVSPQTCQMLDWTIFFTLLQNNHPCSDWYDEMMAVLGSIQQMNIQKGSD